jgi:hypothetical protein
VFKVLKKKWGENTFEYISDVLWDGHEEEHPQARHPYFAPAEGEGKSQKNPQRKLSRFFSFISTLHIISIFLLSCGIRKGKWHPQ